MKIFDFKHKSMISILLISYIIVLILPVVASFIVIFQSVGVINDEVDASKESSLEYVKKSLDEKIKQAKSLSIQVALNPDVVAFSNSNFKNDAEKVDAISALIKNMKRINLSNSYVDHFNIYFNNQDICVTSTSYYRKANAYNALYSYYDITPEEWENMITGTNQQLSIVPLKQKQFWGNNSVTIAIIQNMPLLDQTITTGKIVMLINDKHFSEFFQSISKSELDETFMLDSSNNLIAASSLLREKLDLKYDELKELSGKIDKKVNGDMYSIIYKMSDEWDCKYVTITPKVTASDQSMGVIVFAVTLTVLVILAAVAVIIYVIRRNRQEISSLVEKVANKIGVAASEKDEENEYNYIKNLIDDAVILSEDDHNAYYKQQAFIRQNILLRLLRGKTTDDLVVGGEHSIQFVSDIFSVVIFTIKGSENFFLKEENLTEEEKNNIVFFLIKNVSEELCRQNNNGYTVETEGLMVCIINFTDGISVQDAKLETKRIAETTQSFLNDNLNIVVTAATGNVHIGQMSINASFNEALNAIEYQLMTQSGNYTDIEDIKIDRSGYEYSFETEQRLINCIKTGSADQAKAVVDDILHENIEENTIPVTIAKFLVFDIVSTVLKTLNETSQLTTISEHEYFNKLIVKTDINEISEMRENIYALIIDACKIVVEYNDSTYSKIILDVNKYIEENYADPELSVSKVSAQFFFSTAYLSRIYKDQTKEGMLDVINKTRMAHAKELLRNTNHNIESIAAMTGFTSSTVFIRVFKKYEGITPGKYKELK